MEPLLSPPITRDVSTETLTRLGERQPLLAGDEEQGAQYYEEGRTSASLSLEASD